MPYLGTKAPRCVHNSGGHADTIGRTIRESRWREQGEAWAIRPPTSRSTLVHGDAKPGNFAFTDGQVSAVFDREMTTVGDPLTDTALLTGVGLTELGIDEKLDDGPVLPSQERIDAILSAGQQ